MSASEKYSSVFLKVKIILVESVVFSSISEFLLITLVTLGCAKCVCWGISGFIQ